jgi:hypothetical protein
VFGVKKRLISGAFGNMIYCKHEWRATTKIPVTLWNKTFYVTPTALPAGYYGSEFTTAVLKKRAGINENQERAFCDFKENIIEKQKQIERKAEKYFKTSDAQVLISKFAPNELQVSREGDASLIADNTEPGASIIAFLVE